jgi:formamidopyrimidine-DNA glycosylase
MPEGPEVYMTATQLNERLRGLTLLKVERVGEPERNDYGMDNVKVPSKIHIITSRGKKILIYLEHSSPEDCLSENIKENVTYSAIMSSLGMTGNWSYKQKKHSRYLLRFEGNVDLYYSSPRPFGSNVYICTKEEGDIRFGKVGPCLKLEREKITCDTWRDKIRCVSQDIQICKFLMEQKYFSGVGNYIKSEALYLSRIRPDRTLRSLLDSEIESLRYFVFWVIDKSIESKGLTISNYSTPNDDKGVYIPYVYNRQLDCQGYNVQKKTFKDGRMSHYVEEYQL